MRLERTRVGDLVTVKDPSIWGRWRVVVSGTELCLLTNGDNPLGVEVENSLLLQPEKIGDIIKRGEGWPKRRPQKEYKPEPERNEVKVLSPRTSYVEFDGGARVVTARVLGDTARILYPFNMLVDGVTREAYVLGGIAHKEDLRELGEGVEVSTESMITGLVLGLRIRQIPEAAKTDDATNFEIAKSYIETPRGNQRIL